jgi:hypothetical protein
MNERIRQLVEDLRGAVSQALADSIDVNEALRDIRGEGWALYLVVDRKRTDESLDAYEISAPEPARVEASFRIDSNDVGFLRSIGIDPTRRVRARRAGS